MSTSLQLQPYRDPFLKLFASQPFFLQSRLGKSSSPFDTNGTKMTTRILIIDEDLNSLRTYRDTLSPKSKQWSVDYAENVEQGLESAAANKPDIVIVDLSVNDGHGNDILTRFEKSAPEAQLFITASETDKPKLESTLGASFQFLPSPCPAQRLVSEIQRCVAIDNWLGNDRVKEIVAKMGKFPSLPPIYLKVVNALNSKHADTDSISQAIAGDLAISAKVLQTVNSSFYGFDEKISNIADAISILGTECVKNLVLAIQVFNNIGRSADQKSITDELWHHSMSVAVAARRVASYESKNEKAGEEAYTAGLMHDIGKLILLDAVPQEFAEARKLANETSISQAEAETQIIGCNHAEIGAYVLARWGMPTSLTEAVALHHEPINSFGRSFSALAAVHVANAIVHHRQKPGHPSAAISEAYLVEIGKSDSWDDWLAVSSGNKPAPKEKSGLSLKKQPNTSPSSAQQQTQAAASKANEPETATETSGSDTAALQPEQEASRKSKTPLLALAACVALAAIGIYLLNTVDNSDPFEDFAFEDEPIEKLPHLTETEQRSDQTANLDESEPAIKEEKAVESTGLASKIKAARDLSELSGTEDALQEIFDSQEETAPLSTSEVAVTAPEPREVSTISETKNELPQPQLPKVEDLFPNIELAGIFYNSERPLASVNGRIRRVGDTVSGAQIVRIDQHQIIVKYEETLRSFKLN
ncbi:HDOD domain-containing protein [Pelagicoccus sp. SDUM812002]|uniref:HDOD domain-containing protein n=1 Tax=Pelagicoccus sp. SDUM812002 TaxID=3041266 RepID=UPI00280D065A|nr:HDOD domain-containing protein [Pelagicoccus sp. SDUM812002]MDQ8187631.1 HDOD domain-containing protein [Pelagicoccus sp. SDUM812002]